MKTKSLVILMSSVFAFNAANAGSLEITNCSLSEFSYTYAVETAKPGQSRWEVLMMKALVWNQVL